MPIQRMHPLGAGGCDFPVDPDQPATTEQLFWLATVSPDIVAMLALPSDVSVRPPVPLDRPDASRSDIDGTHLIIDGVLQLVSLDGTPEAPVGVLLPFDDWLPARLDAALLCGERCRGGTPSNRVHPTRSVAPA